MASTGETSGVYKYNQTEEGWEYFGGMSITTAAHSTSLMDRADVEPFCLGVDESEEERRESVTPGNLQKMKEQLVPLDLF